MQKRGNGKEPLEQDRSWMKEEKTGPNSALEDHRSFFFFFFTHLFFLPMFSANEIISTAQTAPDLPRITALYTALSKRRFLPTTRRVSVCSMRRV